MKVYTCKNEKILEHKMLYKALEIDINKSQVISFVGGGGKTTSIYRLAEELSSSGKKVIITTTTHMKTPDKWICFSGDLEEVKTNLNNKSFLVVGSKGYGNKISSINEDVAVSLYGICDFLLVEADGAKMLPLKAPEKHEPVILKNTSMIIGVAGIDSLDNVVNEVCHRPHKVCELLKSDLSHRITALDIGEILSSPKGQRKFLNDFSSIEYRCIINKADSFLLVNKAKEILDYLSKKNIIGVITSHKKD